MMLRKLQVLTDSLKKQARFSGVKAIKLLYLHFRTYNRNLMGPDSDRHSSGHSRPSRLKKFRPAKRVVQAFNKPGLRNF